jgi:hypothetical protein
MLDNLILQTIFVVRISSSQPYHRENFGTKQENEPSHKPTAYISPILMFKIDHVTMNCNVYITYTL